MTKKFVISSFVLLLFLGSAMPAMAAMTVSEVNLTGQFATNWPTVANWPDFNGFAWSLIGTSNGVQPKAKTSPDPNQLPSYATDYGSGTIRVFYSIPAGAANCQTFSTDGNTDGFALTRIAVRISGGGSAIPDENYPFTVHLFDLGEPYGQIPPGLGSVIPANGRPYSAAFDLLSGPAFAADPCMLSVGTWDWDILLAMDFNEYDRVDLEPNHTYAFEVWGPLGWASAPPYIWGMVWNALENTGPAGCGYNISGTADNGNGPGPSNLTNPRGMGLGGVDRDFVVGVYGDYADGNAYHPEPRKYATQVSRTPMLTWHPGKWAKTHRLYMSTTFSQVAQRVPTVNKGMLTDPCYTPTAELTLNKMYYWRVDEFNDDPNITKPQPNPGEYFWGEANNPSGNTTDKNTIYRFMTISPSASNPVPVSQFVPQQAVFKPQSAWLKWTPGALVADNNHQVYFGTSWGDVNHASEANGAPLYRGKVNDPCYPLKNLYPNYTLTSGTTYYWRVDEVNGVNKWTGPVWNFRMPSPASLTIDDFASSADFASMWKTHYQLIGGYTVAGVISLVSNSLSLAYDNTCLSDPNGPWSEAMLDYGVGMDWTIGGVFEPEAIGVLFDGAMGNTLDADDANYDKLYLGIQDAQGKLGVVYYSDVYAARRAITIAADNVAAREWKVALTDLTSPNDVNLKSISKVFVGIGSPRGSLIGTLTQNGGTGTLRYDNIKIYVQHCNPTFPDISAVPGDLAGPLVGTPTTYHTRWTTPDCVVNLHDIYYLASDWLFAEPNFSYSGTMSDPTAANLTAWYTFDNNDNNNMICDYSGNSRHGTLYNPGPFTWWYKGHNNTGKCVNLEPGFHTWIACPNSVVGGDSTGQSFTFWLKHNDSSLEEHTWASVLVFHRGEPNGLADSQQMETQLPADPWSSGTNSPWLRWVDQRVSDETGLQGAAGSRPSMISTRWNHYALVYDTVNTQMRMYVNGKLISGTTSAVFTTPWGPNSTGDGNANTVRIGQRGNTGGYTNTAGWGFWQGRIDDMRLYSKALSVPEVQYLATDGTGSRDMQAVFVERDNFKNSTVTSSYLGGQPVQIINFSDFAKLAEYWALNGQQYQLWPPSP